MEDAARCFKCSGKGVVLKKNRKRRRIDPEQETSTTTPQTEKVHSLPTETDEFVPEKGKNDVVEVPCSCCGGKGIIIAQKKSKHKGKGGIITQPKRPPGWQAPGPQPEGLADAEIQDGEALCYLTGDWRILQPIGGHRYSTDDVVTAWYAGKEIRRILIGRSSQPSSPEQFSFRGLDLGSGLGSVLLMMLWQYPMASYVGVEAQGLSVQRARRSAKVNGCDSRCEFRWGDNRDIQNHVPEGRIFDVLTGTPPYFPLYGGQKGFKDHQESDEVNSVENENSDSKATSDQSHGSDFVSETTDESIPSEFVKPNENEESQQLSRDEERGVPALPAAIDQRPCNWEYRGGIEVYCQAAWKCIKPGGIFIVCEAAGPGFVERVEAAAENAGGSVDENTENSENVNTERGFKIVKRLDVIPKTGLPPLFSVYTMVRGDDGGVFAEIRGAGDEKWWVYPVEQLVVRDENGKRTEHYVAMLGDMGMPP